MAMANFPAQLPRVLEAARPADVLVAAEHDERWKAVVHRLIGVGETELERMLGGEKRHDLVPGHGVAEIGHEMAEVVFLLRADGVIGDHDADVVACQRLDRVVGIDPRVHSLCRFELRPGRTKLDGQRARGLAAK